MTPVERQTLERFRLVATPKATEINDVWKSLQRDGLLSVRPMTGDRTRVRVVTTEAGMQAMRAVTP